MTREAQVSAAVARLRGVRIGRTARRALLRSAPHGSPESARWPAPTRLSSRALKRLEQRGLVVARRTAAPPGRDPVLWGRPLGGIRTPLGEAVVRVLGSTLRDCAQIRWPRVEAAIVAALLTLEHPSPQDAIRSEEVVP